AVDLVPELAADLAPPAAAMVISWLDAGGSIEDVRRVACATRAALVEASVQLSRSRRQGSVRRLAVDDRRRALADLRCLQRADAVLSSALGRRSAAGVWRARRGPAPDVLLLEGRWELRALERVLWDAPCSLAVPARHDGGPPGRPEAAPHAHDRRLARA